MDGAPDARLAAAAVKGYVSVRMLEWCTKPRQSPARIVAVSFFKSVGFRT